MFLMDKYAYMNGSFSMRLLNRRTWIITNTPSCMGN